jgi:hypothetical protein
MSEKELLKRNYAGTNPRENFRSFLPLQCIVRTPWVFQYLNVEH